MKLCCSVPGLVERPAVETLGHQPRPQADQLLVAIVEDRDVVEGFVDDLGNPGYGVEDAIGLAGLHERFRPPAALRRADPAPPGAAGIGAPGLGLGHLLDSQVVAPRGAEVVVVDETLTHPQPEVAQAHPVGVVAEDRAAVVAQAVLPAVHLEAVQVITGPAESHLKNIVEVGDARVAGHEQAPPDQRADPVQHDAQLVDEQGCTGCSHAPSSPGQVRRQ
jgi:hypothetical protein